MKTILAACLFFGLAAAAEAGDRSPRAGGAVGATTAGASMMNYRNPKAGGDADDIVSGLCNRQGCSNLSASEQALIAGLAE